MPGSHPWRAAARRPRRRRPGRAGRAGLGGRAGRRRRRRRRWRGRAGRRRRRRRRRRRTRSPLSRAVAGDGDPGDSEAKGSHGKRENQNKQILHPSHPFRSKERPQSGTEVSASVRSSHPARQGRCPHFANENSAMVHEKDRRSRTSRRSSEPRAATARRITTWARRRHPALKHFPMYWTCACRTISGGEDEGVVELVHVVLRSGRRSQHVIRQSHRVRAKAVGR
jgi:hypothetical protein